MPDMTATPNSGAAEAAAASDLRRLAAQCFAHANDAAFKGHYDFAIQLYLRCCRYAPDNLAFRQALRAAVQRKFHGRRPGRWAALRGLWAKGRVHRSRLRRDYVQLIQACERALTYNPWDTAVLLEQAKACAQLGDLATAMWNLEYLLESEASHREACWQLAEWHEEQGAYEKAAGLWERLKQLDPSDQDVHRRWRRCQVSGVISQLGYEPDHVPDLAAEPDQVVPLASLPRSQPARAAISLEDLKRRVQADPADVPAYLDLAAEHCRQGQLEAAQQVLRQAMQASGGDVRVRERWEDMEAHMLRLRVLHARSMARVDGAEGADKPLEASRGQARSDVEPAAVAAQRRRLEALETELNDYELDVYRRRSDRYPQRAELNYEFGLRLLRAGLIDEAVFQFTTAKAHPDYQLWALVALGHCYCAQGQIARAKECYGEALEGHLYADRGLIEAVGRRLADLSRRRPYDVVTDG